MYCRSRVLSSHLPVSCYISRQVVIYMSGLKDQQKWEALDSGLLLDMSVELVKTKI
ncbi:Hypothetical predicted protein [Podarcis lilfordi]|uniref:Uncharacterized protein n=1 Tax=Podarcis lilfordi TaxID=74358 RepID=A0AA35KL42_9SAUR|nr:Hypothetical predicted protein [Podarcis lilfordi]